MRALSPAYLRLGGPRSTLFHFADQNSEENGKKGKIVLSGELRRLIEIRKTYDSFLLRVHFDRASFSSFSITVINTFEEFPPKLTRKHVSSSVNFPAMVRNPVAETGWINLNNASCTGERWYTNSRCLAKSNEKVYVDIHGHHSSSGHLFATCYFSESRLFLRKR